MPKLEIARRYFGGFAVFFDMSPMGWFRNVFFFFVKKKVRHACYYGFRGVVAGALGSSFIIVPYSFDQDMMELYNRFVIKFASFLQLAGFDLPGRSR